MPQERIFRVRMLSSMPKGKKWAVEEKIFTDKMRHEWEIVASEIPSEPKANEIIEIYKK